MSIQKYVVKIIAVVCIYFACCIIIGASKTKAKELSDGIYTIKSAQNERYVLDITGVSENNLANLEIWENHYGTNQKFYVKSIGDGYYIISAMNSNKYLDVEGASCRDGANVLQFSYHGNSNQQWKIKQAEDGTYYIISRCSGLYLDVAYGIMENGSNVLTWQYNGGINQKFKFEREQESSIEEGIYRIESGQNGKYALDVNGVSYQDCANIQIWENNYGDNQKYRIKAVGDGSYTITAVHSNKNLDVEGASKYNGANVLQFKSNWGDNQKWFLRDAGNGCYYITSKINGLNMDIDSGRMNNGTNVLMWAHTGRDNQKFRLIKSTTTVEEDTGRSAQFKREHPEVKIGIDVSKYQGTIDWKAVKRDGIDYVMIRAGFRGYGSSGSLNEDPKLDEYVRGARAAGLDVGIYFFSQATNYQEGVDEANYTLGLIRKYDITYPVAFDTEDSSSPTHTGRADNISKQDRTDATKGFCSTIKNAGYETLIYASPSWLKDNLYIDQLSEYDIWLANYTGATQEDPLKRPSNYKGKYVMWQYTDSGTVNGIKGKVDCDLFYYLK